MTATATMMTLLSCRPVVGHCNVEGARRVAASKMDLQVEYSAKCSRLLAIFVQVQSHVNILSWELLPESHHPLRQKDGLGRMNLYGWFVPTLRRFHNSEVVEIAV